MCIRMKTGDKHKATRLPNLKSTADRKNGIFSEGEHFTTIFKIISLFVTVILLDLALLQVL